MKFVKSNFAKKLIIVLITIILFNAIVPVQAQAVDIVGIVIKSVTLVVLRILVVIDVCLGVFLWTLDFSLTGIGEIIDFFSDVSEKEDKDEIIGEVYPEKKLDEIVISATTTTERVLGELFVGPDTIFAGKITMLNANIFQATSNPTGGLFSSTGEAHNLPGIIKKGISTTYIALRNICAILMLIGLIFTGIKILVTSNIPSKRSMWLDMIQDWVIGMVLLMFSHVIMVLIFSVSDILANALTKSLGGFGGLNFNLIVQCLISFDAAEQIICLVMLGYLIYLTIIFVVAYFKRLIWVCVLIVIAPLVSVMYAFGSQTKQIYSKWLKEYITTALIQPFHIIVYTVLIAIPLNMVDSNGSVDLLGLIGGGSLLKTIYALIALSFIRPAEKYVRELFGMGQGIAGMASFDSGKQTIDAIKEAFESVQDKFMLAASSMMSFGGGGGPHNMEEAKAQREAREDTSSMGSMMKSMGEDISKNGGFEPETEENDGNDENSEDGENEENSEDEENEDSAEDSDGSASDTESDVNVDAGTDTETSVDVDMGGESSGGGGNVVSSAFNTVKGVMSQVSKGVGNLNEFPNKIGSMGNTLKDFTEIEDVMSSSNSINTLKVDRPKNKWHSKLTQEDIDDAIEREIYEPEGPEYEQFLQEKGLKLEEKINIDFSDVTKKIEEHNKIENDIEQDNETKEEIVSDEKDVNQELIEAANMLKEAAIMLGNSRSGNNTTNNSNNDSEAPIKLKEDNIEDDKEDNNKNNDKDFVVSDYGSDLQEEKDQKDWAINNPIRYIEKGRKILDGEESISDVFKGGLNGKIFDKLSDSKLGDWARNNPTMQKAKEKFDVGEEFLRQGGFKDLHEGFNEVRDTFFVSPGGGSNAPKDWQNTQKELEARQKEKNERIKDRIVNDKANQQDIIEKDKLLKKLRNQYPDESEEYIRDKAENKAKEKLEKMCKTYLSLGIKDPKLMYSLEKYRKEYGLSPKEAIIQRAEIERTNNSVKM